MYSSTKLNYNNSDNPAPDYYKSLPSSFYDVWGSNAQSKLSIINNSRHCIIKSVHPSPLSSYRGFFGSKPFSKANDFLEKNNIEKVRW